MHIAILNNKTVGKELGKEGTKTDIIEYTKKEGKKQFCYYEPVNYPEKVNPLLVALNLSEYVLFFVDEINAAVGEQIITVDLMQKDGVFVCEDYIYEQLKPVLKETILAGWKRIDKAGLREHLLSLNEKEVKTKKKMVIDNSFEVKSVGLVLLGKSLQPIAVHDTLTLYPQKKEITVKSIQVHDENIEKTKVGDRTGLAIRGVDITELERGNILASEALEVKKDIEFGEIRWNKIGLKLADKEQGMLCCGLQFVQGQMEGNKIELAKEIAYEEGDQLVILKPNAKMRVLGVVRLK